MRLGKPTSNPLVVLREEFDDWALLFDPDSGNVSALSPVSVFIWKRLDGNHTEENILNELRHHFRNVPPEAEAHIKGIIKELVDRGFAGYELSEP